MAHIDIIGPDEAQGRLAEVYAEVMGKRGRVSEVLAVHSLLPDTMLSHLRMYMDIMFAKGALTRLEREAIAVVVSSANRCTYCVKHHDDALAVYLKDPAARATLAEDPDKAPVEPRLKALLRFARKLTLTPHEMGPADLDALRTEGWDDAAILHANLVASYFNFVNRNVLGLGVELERDRSGYKY